MGLGFLRDAYWLSGARVRGYLILFALANIVTLTFLIATSSNGVDRNGFLLGSDFLSFWTVGQMLQTGGAVYDAAAHTAMQRTYFAQGDGYTAFFYPPLFLLFCWPLGFLPYFPALGLWLLTTGAAYGGAVHLWLRRMKLRQPVLLLLAAFPPVVISITHGQTSFLLAALLGLGVLLVPARPVLAGVCFGLATIKPQFGLLVPLVLLLTGEWRVIMSAALTAITLGLVSTFAFGTDIWFEWYEVSGSARAALEQGIVPYAKMQSALAATLLFAAAPLWLAWMLQIAVGLCVVTIVAFASWRQRFDIPLGVLMLTGAPLITPFVLDYDMTLLAFPLIWLVGQTPRSWERIACAAAFVAPAFSRPLAMEAGVPIMPLAMLGLFAVIASRVLKTSVQQ